MKATTSFTSQDEACYRVILKRIVSCAMLNRVAPMEATENLEYHVKRVIPLIVSKFCEQAFNRSAKAWEDGNNSGNSFIMDQKDSESLRWATAGERVMALFGIKCDWPGLYPSFQIEGRIGHYYDALSVLKAALEPAKSWEVATA